MILGAIGYSYSVSTVASCFGNTAYGRLAFQDRLHNMEFYLSVCAVTVGVAMVYACVYAYTAYHLLLTVIFMKKDKS